MTYEEIKEISSRFESFDEKVVDVDLKTGDMTEEPDFWYCEARINIKTENGAIEIARIEIDENPKEGVIYAYKNKLYGLTFEQRTEQDRAYDVCKGIIKDYLNGSLI